MLNATTHSNPALSYQPPSALLSHALLQLHRVAGVPTNIAYTLTPNIC